jgi:hypothetical protein
VLIQGSSGPPRLVRVGIDAAIVAQHEVCIRATDAQGRVRTDRFRVQPTLAGLRSLSNRLAEMPGVVAVAEPTSMTWLALSVALRDAGCDLSLLGARHAARLRGAISGKHKSDVIDAEVLARAGEVFDLHRLRPVEPAQLALRRACVRRGGSVIDGNRHLRRLISLARWAFPDVWNAFRGSLPTAVAVLDRWPHLAQLATARRSTLTAVVALHTRGVADVPDRVEAIRSAAAAWAAFWAGHLDLDALAFDVTEHLTDMADAKARTERATGQTQRYWRQLYGDDELLPVGAWHGTGHRVGDPRLPRRRHRVRLGKGSGQLCRVEPVALVLGHGVSAQPGDHQGRARSAPVGVLPSRECGPAAGSAAGRVLPPADDRTRSLPHPGLRGGSPQAAGADLDSAQPRHPLPDP